MAEVEETGLSDEEFDRGFLQTQRSDMASIVSRIVTLVVVFGVLAYGIHVHGLAAGFLLLPLGVEFLLIGWVGLFLSLTVVDCQKFAKVGRSPGFVLFSTLAIAIIISCVLAIEDNTFEVGRILPGWRSGWEAVRTTGLVWALIVECLTLLFATGLEVHRWRREGGTFIWASSLGIALRLTAVFLVGLALYFLMMFTAGLGSTWVFETPLRRSWFVFVFLLCVEVGALLITIKIHSDLVRESKQA